MRGLRVRGGPAPRTNACGASRPAAATRAWVFALVGLSSACSAGSAAREIRPADPTAKDALGEGSCTSTKGAGTPLVVDLEAHERADLEDAMGDGIAVVAWSCESLKLLPDCHASGSYAFHGLSPQEFTVKLDDADEVRANLPAFGASVLGKIESEMKRGATLDLAISMIGKRRTTVAAVRSMELSGHCEGATHFVRGAYVGAFAMATGTRGDLRAAAEIFKIGADASSKSAKLAEARDGDLDTCRAFDAAAARPPARCSSLVRLELAPLGGALDPSSSKPDVEVGEAACAEGLVLVDHKCAATSIDRPFLCRADKPVECDEQCTRGHMQSCAVLGALYARGEGVPKDATRAASFLERSCEGGEALACVNAGVLMERGEGGPKDPVRAAAFYKKACALGDGKGCFDFALLAEPGAVGADLERVADAYRQGCDLGEAAACVNLGILAEAGRARLTDVASALFERACEGGSGAGCFNAARLLDQGPTRDPARALAAFGRACELGVARGCFFAGQHVRDGSGSHADPARACELYAKACDAGVAEACSTLGATRDDLHDAAAAAAAFKQGCDAGDPPSCVELGRMVEEGRGLPPNPARAVTLYESACAKGNALGCMHVGAFLVSHEPPKFVLALEAYAKACELGEATGCYEAAELLVSGDVPADAPRAKALLKRACAANVEGACAAEKAH
ncbi:MAG: tetratricopeptide repeat protein [Polyangiaceae bacterium]